jgi:dolichol-phosphate mannosyltransferase
MTRPSSARPAVVVLPTYNEAENLPGIAEAILAASPDLDLLVVDDGSPDGTGRLADALASQHERVRVLHRTRKDGLGKAYIAGFAEALARGYRYVLQMDADFSHDPAYLPELLARVRRTPLVLGSRYVAGGGTKNWGLGRRLLSRGGSLYARTLLGLGVRDLTGGFKAWQREALEAIGLDDVRSTGYAFQIELTLRAVRRGFAVEELPIVFVDRRVGKSKMSRAIVLEALWRVWALRGLRAGSRP